MRATGSQTALPALGRFLLVVLAVLSLCEEARTQNVRVNMKATFNVSSPILEARLAPFAHYRILLGVVFAHSVFYCLPVDAAVE